MSKPRSDEQRATSAAYMREWRDNPDYRAKHAAYERERRASTDQRASERSRYMRRREQVLGRIKERVYGVTPAEYAEMLHAQHGVCAICGHPETAKNGKAHTMSSLAIDHDHDTGRVRGLLCARCNRALGGFRDEPGILQAALAYLTKEH